MHESITFSNSQSSGHLLTHLYNVQESHLAYSKNKKLTHSNDVFLAPTKVNGRTNYYPRTINVEYSGGYGFMSKYEFHEKSTDIDILAEQYGSVVIQQLPKPEKNEYQKCLDSGLKPDQNMLNKENTKLWTSYNKLIYRPSSLMELPNYQHPSGTNKNFSRLHFDEYPVGLQEFQVVHENLDDTFRLNLEALDCIQGLNFVTELDNAWGGFTNELLMEIKDEYFNNGANSKHNLWTYGLYGLNAQNKNILTQIRAFVSFAQSSSLFIPLQVPKLAPGILNSSYDSSSEWHKSAVQSLLVNSIWGLNCQLALPTRMAAIEAELQRGYGKRTIVNEIEIERKKSKISSQFGAIQDVIIMDYYNNPAPVIPVNSNSDSLNSLQLGINQNGTSKLLSEISIDGNGAESVSFCNDYMQEALEQDSFPQIFESNFKFSATMKQTTSIKQTLKDYKKIISRVRLPQHLEIIGEKGELIEDVSLLIEEYTIEYSDESDIDD